MGGPVLHGWPRSSRSSVLPGAMGGPVLPRRERSGLAVRAFCRGKRCHPSSGVALWFPVPPDCDGPVLPGAMGGPVLPVRWVAPFFRDGWPRYSRSAGLPSRGRTEGLGRLPWEERARPSRLSWVLIPAFPELEAREIQPRV